MLKDKLGFTGSQFGITQEQIVAVTWILYQAVKAKIWELHHGDCIGADATVHRLARAFRMYIIVHPPLLDKKRAHCFKPDEVRPKAKYLHRNRDIVDETGWLLACPKTNKMVQRSGTWTTVRYAVRKHRRVIIVWPDGRFSSARLKGGRIVFGKRALVNPRMFKYAS